ncbi:hypothetical protein KNP414_06321 [Paenibacillus mucilaginosus KNP414]|uniref:Uncharacterized protein n=1 Tax=Paenibacillus mucilaginosus (strain KNP414) TaxID=1036673 RepID=F8FLS6_PAEMK|nr:hypothetical protein KNP414_06321 [Paenibacillus mucilaginosus KNP414]
MSKNRTVRIAGYRFMMQTPSGAGSRAWGRQRENGPAVKKAPLVYEIQEGLR